MQASWPGADWQEKVQIAHSCLRERQVEVAQVVDGRLCNRKLVGQDDPVRTIDVALEAWMCPLYLFDHPSVHSLCRFGFRDLEI